MSRTLRAWIAGLIVLALLLAGYRIYDYVARALPVATGYSAKLVCSLVYLAGRDPESIFDSYVRHEVAPAGDWVDVEFDLAQRVVSVDIFGIARARALYRPGVGCTLLNGVAQAELEAQTKGIEPRSDVRRSFDLPWPHGDAAVASAPPAAISAAIDRAFAEPDAIARQTLAVLVVHQGRLIAERYAPGTTQRTPMLSWSVAKSVIATLIGIAEARGLLELDAPAPVDAWRGDARRAITLRDLLQMSSGLAFEEIYGPGADATQMLFREQDMGAFAAAKPQLHMPGDHWSYSSGTANLNARILKQAVGGSLANAWRFGREVLFDPVGMQSFVFEADTSGSFVGSSYAFATARDWARFAELHLRDGIWQGRRVLPEGWVEFVTTPVKAAPKGEYGGHWWLNAGNPQSPSDRMWPSLPRDVYAARGHSGQYLIVVPSAELVVVRLGHGLPNARHGVEALMEDLLEALAGVGGNANQGVGRVGLGQ